MAKTDETPKAPKDKAASFKKLANARVTKALNAIAVIGNLANKNSYDYGDEEITKIFEALKAELETTYKRFTQPQAQAGKSFSL